ncbi:hypothetical protein JW899_01520 [Candidatus Uhrbacteria bacterium]|nr:hypothetical protein [Candidatus Uhrbacteria bacterium]
MNRDPKTWSRQPKYCVLLRLRSPKAVAKPFWIDKRGFGNAAAWLTVRDIKTIVMS